jgi:sterol O-acyltransferase
MVLSTGVVYAWTLGHHALLPNVLISPSVNRLMHVVLVNGFIVVHTWIALGLPHWMQRLVYMCHSVVMYLKIHGYMSTNSRLYLKYTVDGEYKQDLSISNWIDWLCVPTLLYQPTYPRTPHIRWSFALVKALGALECIAAMYILLELHYIPLLIQYHGADLYSFAMFTVHVPVLGMCGFVLIFYIIFEEILNMMAEVTQFADRRFYNSWWNATGYAEFAFQWNRTTHLFLFKHVYEPLKMGGYSKLTSRFVTFFLSALFHEWIVAVTMRRIYGFPCFIAILLLQLPLVFMGDLLYKYDPDTFNGLWSVGNTFFWFGQCIGPSMIFYLYTWDDVASLIK